MSIWINQPDADGNCCDCDGRMEPCDSCTPTCSNDYYPVCFSSGFTSYDFLVWAVGNGSYSASASEGSNSLSVNGGDSGASIASVIQIVAAFTIVANTIVTIVMNGAGTSPADFLGMGVDIRSGCTTVVYQVSTASTSHTFVSPPLATGKYYITISAASGPQAPDVSNVSVSASITASDVIDFCPIPS